MKLNKHYISRLLYELLKLPRVGGRGDFSDVGRALNASTPREKGRKFLHEYLTQLSAVFRLMRKHLQCY